MPLDFLSVLPLDLLSGLQLDLLPDLMLDLLVGIAGIDAAYENERVFVDVLGVRRSGLEIHGYYLRVMARKKLIVVASSILV